MDNFLKNRVFEKDGVDRLLENTPKGKKQF
jgi:hypothetical protein